MAVDVTINGTFNLGLVRKNLEIKVSQPISFEDLLKKVEKQTGIQVHQLALSTRGKTIFSLNSKIIQPSTDLSCEVRDGDQVKILQALSGG
ncbi:MAG: MoaD/ThiS family protein [Desulfatiglans sp.]|jgi:sulfur carrier protein ThiS|nr:MoaD/ThiS family protein [Thermodesulfobacteriota bacterium]MEE4352352.1 MoaD/ThiS family protein [Desulfatiglans sp.]